MESRNISTRTSSREEMRRERRRQSKQTAPKKEFDSSLYKDEKIRIRIIPIWLRIILVVVLSIIAVFLGLIIGYAVLGDGSFGEVFKMSTWTHLIDLVLKE